MEGTTVSFVNQKGGSGKSTTCCSMGASLIQRGFRVLFIDSDPQRNLSGTLRADPHRPGLYEILTGRSTAQEAVQPVGIGADIIAGSQALADAEAAGGKDPAKLANALQAIRNAYDFILIDTPPAVSALTIGALTASNGIITTACADSYSLEGIGQLYESVTAVRSLTNPGLKMYGIVITRYDRRPVISRKMAEMIEDTAASIGTKVFQTRIRNCTAIQEAQAMQTDIFTHAPHSNAACDYRALTDEFLKEIEQ